MSVQVPSNPGQLKLRCKNLEDRKSKFRSSTETFSFTIISSTTLNWQADRWGPFGKKKKVIKSVIIDTTVAKKTNEESFIWRKSPKPRGRQEDVQIEKSWGAQVRSLAWCYKNIKTPITSVALWILLLSVQCFKKYLTMKQDEHLGNSCSVFLRILKQQNSSSTSNFLLLRSVVVMLCSFEKHRADIWLLTAAVLSTESWYPGSPC